MQEYDMNGYDYQKTWTKLRGQFLRDHIRQNNSRKGSCGSNEVVQSTWKWYKQLKFLKSGEIVLNSNLETIDWDAPILKHKKPTDKLTKKKNVLDKSIEILNLKPEERTEADVDIFGKMVAVTLKPLNPY